MLLEFTCSNHRSIRKSVTFSMLAGKDTTFEDSLMTFKNSRILRSSVVYGANGSGKSTFIDAVSFVKRLVTRSFRYETGRGIRQTPHKLNGVGSPSEYQVHFVSNGTQYVYGFTLQNLCITEEYLYYYPGSRVAKIFARGEGGFEVGSKFGKRAFSNCEDMLRPNRLALSLAANYCDVPEIRDAFSFFADDLIIFDSPNQENWLRYSLYEVARNPGVKESALTLLRALGVDAKDITVLIDKKQFDPNELPPIFSDEFLSRLLGETPDSITAKISYQGFDVDLFTEESTGVKKLFSMICPILDILAKDKVLVCDEMEANFHESLMCNLLLLFADASMDSCAQLVFTTHETSLLDLDFLRRDQIWFAEMRPEDRSTDLYSLAELQNVRKDDNFVRGYISGRYGAIPMLNKDFASVVNSIRKNL